MSIKVRNRLSVKSLLKASIPFVVASTYGIIRQRGVLSVENQKARYNFIPYLTGGSLASGASFALTPKRRKVYVKLMHYNSLGTLVRTEGQWVDVRKLTSIEIKHPRNGWVNVSVVASEKQGLKIQQINFASDSSGLGEPINGPTTNDDGDDFGIESGSGTAADPYILSNINVYPDYGDAFTSFGDGFYYGSGGSVDGYTFPPGYYQDQSAYTPPPPANPSPPSINDFKWKKEPANCAAYNHLFSASVSAQKEMGGVVTADGQLITLPSQNNLINSTDFSGQYKDVDGHIIATIYPQDGKWYIDLNDFSTAQGTTTPYEIVGMVHTHPDGIDPSTGQPWDTYNPSSNDIALLGAYPGLTQYIKTSDSSYNYDQYGADEEFVPGCN